MGAAGAGLKIGGHHRPAAVTGRDPGSLGGVRATEKGLRYPADPPTVEKIILVMREAGPGPCLTGRLG